MLWFFSVGATCFSKFWFVATLWTVAYQSYTTLKGGLNGLINRGAYKRNNKTVLKLAKVVLIKI